MIKVWESFAEDITNLLRLFNQEKIRLTKVKEFLTKVSLKKMGSVLKIKGWETLEEVRNIEMTHLLFVLF